MKVILAAILVIAMCAPAEDKVSSLPLMLPFDTYGVYSGYIDIGGKEGKHMHYIFVEAETNKATAPLVVWFNGGPGCSSVLAWAQEHGPWIMPDGSDQFIQNPFSWNKKANMLYIESPAGVGYSYTDKPNPEYDDVDSAKDNYATVLGWFEKFPEYKNNKFFIAGESYAGIYVPYLAQQIVAGENDIKLEGILVGNGVTNWDLDCENAYLSMGFWHNLEDIEWESQMEKNHCFNENLGARTTDNSNDVPNKDMCDTLELEFEQKVGRVNVYDVYRHCYYPDEKERTQLMTIDGEEKEVKLGMTAQEYTPWLFKQHEKQGLKVDVPCVYATGTSKYFNRQDVRNALHIKTSQTWELCTDRIKYTRLQRASQWIYPTLKQHGIRVLHYSGNTDGAVPTEGTRNWIRTLGWKVTSEYQPYYVRNKQVGGFVEEREGITLATVQGVGHMAPQWYPEASYYVFTQFLDGKHIANPEVVNEEVEMLSQ